MPRVSCTNSRRKRPSWATVATRLRNWLARAPGSSMARAHRLNCLCMSSPPIVISYARTDGQAAANEVSALLKAQSLEHALQQGGFSLLG